MTIQAFKLQIIGASIASAASTLAKGRVLLTLQSLGIIPGAGGGVIIPSSVEVILSASGLGSADLYTDGNSQYLVEIWDINGRKAGEWLLTMPLSNCYLHDVIGVLPVGTLTQAQAAIVAAQSYVAQASAFSDSAGAYSVVAQGYRDTTLTYKNAAAQSATNASTSEGNALASANAASGSKDAAAASATLAQQWAVNLTAVPGGGGLFGSKYYANAASTSAAAAAQSVTDASGFAGAASASALQAQGYNASALGYSNLAQQWATSTSVVTGGFYGALKYAQDAAAAVALATAQANLAVNASSSAQGSMTAAQQAQALASQFMQIASQYAAQGASVLQQLFTQLASAATITAAVTSTSAASAGASAQAQLANQFALSAMSVAQQDLSGVNVQALHRNAATNPTALFVYDVSKDSDGGAWTAKCQDKSWAQETLNGAWLGQHYGEMAARGYAGSLVQGLGAEMATNPLTLSNYQAFASATMAMGASGGIRMTQVTINGGIQRSFATVPGKFYLVAYDVVASTANYGIIFSTSANVDGGLGGMSQGQGAGRRYAAFRASSTVSWVALTIYGSAGTYTEFNGMSLKEVLNMDNLAPLANQDRPDTFTLSNMTGSLSSVVAPDGVTFMSRLADTVGTTQHFATYNHPVALPAGIISATLHFQKGEYSKAFIYLDNQGGLSMAYSIDLTTGVATATRVAHGSWTGISITVTPAAFGSWKVVLSGTTTNTVIGLRYGQDPGGTYDTFGLPSAYVGDTTKGIYAWGLKLQVGAATPYVPNSVDALKYYQDAQFGTHLTLSAGNGTTQTFVGNRADFPKLTAWVGEIGGTGYVYAYDLTQPGRPLWRTFRAGGMLRNGNVASIRCINGELLVGCGSGSGDLHRINFIKDSSYSVSNGGINVYNGSIAQRNANLGYTLFTAPQNPVPLIANRQVYQIDAAVLPDAPLDPATGLQVPTVAVATAGGVTVIQNNGVCVNSSNTGAFNGVTINKDILWCHNGASGSTPFYALSPGSLGAAFNINAMSTTAPDMVALPAANGVTAVTTMGRWTVARLANNTSQGVSLMRMNPSNYGLGLAARIAGYYNTGWMTGAIMRALCSTTVAGNYSGVENVLNGTFDVDLSNWTKAAGDGSAIATGGVMQITQGATTAEERRQIINVTPGRTYRISAILGGAGSPFLFIGSSAAAADLGNLSATGFLDVTAPVTGTISLRAIPQAATGSGLSATFDNISVKEVMADRTYKLKNSSINGTLTSAPVATGAQLLAISGFSNDPAQTLELATAGYTTSGGFDNVVSGISASGFTSTQGTGGSTRVFLNVPTVFGRKYLVNFSSTIGAALGVFARDGNGGTGTILGSIGAAAVGANSFTFTANGAASSVLFAVTPAQAFSATGVSIKPADALGSAANVIQEGPSTDLDMATGQFQGEAFFSAPTTGFGPSNLIAYSEALDNIYFTQTGLTITADQALSPLGTQTAEKLALAAAGTNFILRDLNPNASGTVTGISHWKLGDGANPFVVLILYQAATGDSVRAWFNLSTGAVASTTVGGAATGLTASMVAAGNGFYKCSVTGTFPTTLATIRMEHDQSTANGNYTGAIGYNYAWGFGFNRGTSTQYVPTNGTAYNGIAPIFDRSAANGAYWRMGIDGNGLLAAEINDTVSTVRVQGNIACNDGAVHHARMTYKPGAFQLYLDGQAYGSAGVSASTFLTLNNALACLTIGNRFALDSAFPGWVANVRVGQTVPFAEQMAFMFAQEAQMYKPGAQVSLVELFGLQRDMSYDDALDRWTVITDQAESIFVGLTRVGGSIGTPVVTKLTAARSGVRLTSRVTSGQGVDVTMPSQSLRDELYRRAEAAAALARLPQTLDVDSIASQTDFALPVGTELMEAFSVGALKREGASKDYIRLNDGFKETVRFGTQQGTNWIRLNYRRAA